MVRPFQIAILVACALLTGCGAPQPIKLTWTQYNDTKGAFSILMPAAPEVKADTGFHPAGDAESGSHTATVELARFIVSYDQLPPAYVQQMGGGFMEGYLNSGRRSGTILLAQSATTVANHPAMEYEVQEPFGLSGQPPRVVKGRLVQVNNRVYDIAVESLPGTVAPADVAKFLESFKPAGM